MLLLLQPILLKPADQVYWRSEISGQGDLGVVLDGPFGWCVLTGKPSRPPFI